MGERVGVIAVVRVVDSGRGGTVAGGGQQLAVVAETVSVVIGVPFAEGPLQFGPIAVAVDRVASFFLSG
jgi:hypothetical protein